LTINDRLTDKEQQAHAANAQELAEEILRGMAGWRAAAASEGFTGLLGRALSMAHVHVMFTLHKHGSMRMSDLAAALDISVANATGIVTRMEERGLLERSRDANDRRVVNVVLTDEGRELLEDMDRRRREFFTSLLSRISVEELTQLRNGMRAMFRVAGEAMARHQADREANQADRSDQEKEQGNE
jgi:DNA-binding MarR family transcriptional regulator